MSEDDDNKVTFNCEGVLAWIAFLLMVFGFGHVCYYIASLFL